MRILVLCADPGVPIHGPSGASAHLRGIARGLAARGHVVTVGALHASDGRGRYDSPLGVRSFTVGRPRWPDGLRTLGERLDSWRLARRARRLGPWDLVYERYSLRGDGGLRLARRLGVPHVLEVNAPLSLERGRPSRVERHVLRGADRVVVVSDWLARWARGLGARDVHVVPNGSDLVPTGSPTAGLRLVHHGSGRSWHGTGFLGALLDRLPDAELHTMGGVRVDHPRAVAWPHRGPEALQDHLSTCHVGLLPYPRDAPPWFDPLKLHDYRAVGLPVVGSRHPAARGADRRVDPADLEGWVRAVRELAGSRRVERRPWVVVAEEALGPLER